MRIIAGRAKGRRLAGPPGKGTRPLTDRVREALFSSLGERVRGRRVLDLYAGTGAIGLEALSRGAAAAQFVESDRRTAEVLASNIAVVGLGGEVVVQDVARFLAATTGQRFDLAFVDPPYGLPLASVLEVMEQLEPTLADEATVIVHRRRGDEPPLRSGSLRLTDERRYGDAIVWRYERGQA